MSTSDTSGPLTLKIIEMRQLNPLICLFRLAAPDGKPLPAWSPGSHLQIQVTLPDGTQDWRHYSLVELGDAAGQLDVAPQEYMIAVRKEAQGRGGSRYMHENLHVGNLVTVEPPKNDFPLKRIRGTTILLAGGIGITPLASMAAYCHANDRPVRLLYAGRSRALMAFVKELGERLGSDMVVHADDECDGKVVNLGSVLDACAPEDHLYVCGPRPMLDAALAAVESRRWAPERVHFELFTTPAAVHGDHAFEVVLAHSGQTLEVRADQTLLDRLIEHGCDPLFDCKRGECGVCTTGVLEGEIDHRDYVLTQTEKDSGKMMQICVSRAKGKRLVLDM